MDTLLFASFLAGSLLTILLPTLLLLAIVAWYHVEARRVPGPPPPLSPGAAQDQPTRDRPAGASPPPGASPPAGASPPPGASPPGGITPPGGE